MADLGAVLAAVVSAIAEARRQADEQTAMLAEQYASEPLLAGMSIPRVRLPHVTIDLPLVIEGTARPEPGKPATPAVVAKAATDRMRAVFRSQGLRLPSNAVSTYQEALKRAVAGMRLDGGNAVESYVRAVEAANLQLAEKFPQVMDERVVRLLDKELGAVARRTALATPPNPGGVNVEVVTGKVREAAEPGLVTRLHLQLHEDAVEWAIIDNDDGTQSRRLLPE